MKKQLAVLAIAGSMIFAMSHAVSAETPIKVVVGGERVKTDVAPIIVEGRTMLPVRAVFEAIGADVDYIAAERKVVATRKDKTVEFVIDSNIMKINGQEKQIDVPAMIKDDRTLVPLRACAEAFDLDVEWNDKTRTAKVKKEVSVATESFEFGKTTKHSYDENGNLIYSTSSDGSWKKYDYDENKNMIYFEDSFGYWTKYTYDENGYNTLWEDPVLGIIEIENDKNGNKIYAKDSGGAVWEYE